MQLHETLARFSDIVRSYEVLQYDVEGLHTRLKLSVVFHDESQLYIRETILEAHLTQWCHILWTIESQDHNILGYQASNRVR